MDGQSGSVTPAQVQVLAAYLATGSAKGAAAALGRSEQGVKNTLAAIRLHLDVVTTAQAVWRLRRELEAGGLR